MTPDTILAALRRPAVAVCSRCNGASGHGAIPGEGASVCVACVYRIGAAVADPMHADLGVLEHCRDALEVVAPQSCKEHGVCYVWARSWPGTGDLTLIGGGQA